eukprot:2538571-Amphidinium_carterae.1
MLGTILDPVSPGQFWIQSTWPLVKALTTTWITMLASPLMCDIADYVGPDDGNWRFVWMRNHTM